MAVFVDQTGAFHYVTIGGQVAGFELAAITARTAELSRDEFVVAVSMEAAEGEEIVAVERAEPSGTNDATGLAAGESFGDVDIESIGTALAEFGLAGIPANGASFRGRRVENGRSVSGGSSGSRFPTEPVGRFDGAGASSALPVENVSDAFDAPTAGEADDFFTNDDVNLSEVAEILSIPESTPGFRGRFVTRAVSLR